MIVLAGGSGSRLGADRNKVYLPLAGKPVLRWSVDAFAATPLIERLVVVVRPIDHESAAEALLGLREADFPGGVTVVPGGADRHASESAGLRTVASAVAAGEIDLVAVHDGARPMIEPGMITTLLRAAGASGGALPGLPLTDVVRRDDLGPAGDERTLWRVQTPQVFRARELLDAYAAADRVGFAGTDTSACVERFTELAVTLIPGTPDNLKITYPADVSHAERLLRDRGKA